MCAKYVCMPRNVGQKLATASHDIGHLARYLSMELAALKVEVESESVTKGKRSSMYAVTVQRLQNEHYNSRAGNRVR